ncbi:hypothetical protein ABEB36_006666 [Hypothenemus hampei]|uniref:Uncharacterized protein n=1 Tax=Hypothenemus hampei TaxID=57062 RepID=A0ABD1ERC1_HYPHA
MEGLSGYQTGWFFMFKHEFGALARAVVVVLTTLRAISQRESQKKGPPLVRPGESRILIAVLEMINCKQLARGAETFEAFSARFLNEILMKYADVHTFFLHPDHIFATENKHQNEAVQFHSIAFLFPSLSHQRDQTPEKVWKHNDKQTKRNLHEQI